MNEYYSDQVCANCGALVGGGCPESTPEEREAFQSRRVEQPAEEVAEEVRVVNNGSSFYSRVGTRVTAYQPLQGREAATVRFSIPVGNGKYDHLEVPFFRSELQPIEQSPL